MTTMAYLAKSWLSGHSHVQTSLSPDLSKTLVEDIRCGRRSAMLVNDSITDDEVGKSIDSSGMALSGVMIALLMATAKDVFRTTTMVFNEAKLLVDERPRLYSRQFGYCDTATLPHLNNVDEGHGG